MNALEKSIEGYNQEKSELIKDIASSNSIEMREKWVNAYKERLGQIDIIIERLLTLEYYPSTK